MTDMREIGFGVMKFPLTNTDGMSLSGFFGDYFKIHVDTKPSR